MTQAANLTTGVPQSPPFATADVAALLLALTTCHRGTSRPDVLTNAPSGQKEGFWIKTVSSTVWEWNYFDGSTDILIGTINPTSHGFVPASGGSGDFASDLAGDHGAIVDVASASTCDIGAAGSWRVRITGTTAITSFGTGANKLRTVVFAGALTLTHNATSLILPTGANITTAAGDTAWFQSDGSGNWRCLSYQRADGMPVAPASTQRTALGFGSGYIVQTAYAEYLTNAALTSVIPIDDTIPQNTEGTEILSVSITPRSTSNKLRIRFAGECAPAAGDNMAVAAFVNSAANAIAARYTTADAGYGIVLTLEAEYAPASTSPQTIKIRAGSGNGNMRFNGNSSGRIFGGVSKTTLVVEEIAP